MNNPAAIYTHAARIPKPKKDDIYRLVRCMIESPEEFTTEDSLAQLYAFFIPSPGAKPQDSFAWVAKAVAGPKDIREYLRYVYVADGFATATDGHRLHRAPSQLDPGWYDQAGSRIEDPGYTYPDVMRIIPARSESLTHTVGFEDLVFGPAPTTTPDLRMVADLPDDGPRLNRKYLLDALSMIGPKPATFTVQYPDDTSAMRFDLPGNAVAVCMPIRK